MLLDTIVEALRLLTTTITAITSHPRLQSPSPLTITTHHHYHHHHSHDTIITATATFIIIKTNLMTVPYFFSLLFSFTFSPCIIPYIPRCKTRKAGTAEISPSRLTYMAAASLPLTHYSAEGVCAKLDPSEGSSRYPMKPRGYY